MTSPINIIAVGGGKGGIGKSVVCTNLAAGMALSGQKVILMDTDLERPTFMLYWASATPLTAFRISLMTRSTTLKLCFLIQASAT
jgi:MinD superfamily P-loop ATPase